MLAHGSSTDFGIQAPGGVLACSQELLAPPRLIMFWARLRARGLDVRLAAGTDPSSSRLAAARAAQLATPQARARVASGLEALALSRQQAPSPFSITPQRGAIAPNRSRLLELAATLRSARPVYAGGVARARLIALDGTGPAYTDRRGEGLARELELADEQLLGRERHPR